LVHCDAVQAAGKVSIDVEALGVDFLALSAHKVYGPKGIGALYIRRDKKDALAPLIYGGGQESGLRGGTLNVPGIVGFGAAAKIAKVELESENERIKVLRDRLWAKMQDLKGVHLNGALTDRLCGNLNVSFDGVDGEMMLLELQNELAVSASSACSSAAHKGSHVLRALGLSGERISAAFRIGIGRFNTEAEIDRAAEVLAIAQQKARC
jgi:cysteine desulfurase